MLVVILHLHLWVTKFRKISSNIKYSLLVFGQLSIVCCLKFRHTDITQLSSILMIITVLEYYRNA
jgi:hypothetical protein